MIRRREKSIIQQYWSYNMGSILPLAYLLDWGWLRIGPPYMYININPVIVYLGPLALRWYGLVYVVGIVLGLGFIAGYTKRSGMNQGKAHGICCGCVVAGLIVGALYLGLWHPNV